LTEELVSVDGGGNGTMGAGVVRQVLADAEDAAVTAELDGFTFTFPAGQSNDVLNRLAHGHLAIGCEQNTGGTHVPGLTEKTEGLVSCPNEFNRESHVEPLRLTLFGHCQRTIYAV
jgi:hypothetical protein